MSAYSPDPPSLTGQGPSDASTLNHDGSTILPRSTDTPTASVETTAHSPSRENHNPHPDQMWLYGIATYIGDNDEFGLELDLNYIRGRGCYWTVQLQRINEFIAERREKTISLPGLFVDFFSIRQEWEYVELTEQVWASLRDRLWEENVANSGVDRDVLMTKMKEAKFSPSAEEEYARFDEMFERRKKVEEVREEFAARLESIGEEGSGCTVS